MFTDGPNSLHVGFITNDAEEVRFSKIYVKGGKNQGLIFENFFQKNSLYRGKIMRKIDYAHSRIVKMLP